MIFRGEDTLSIQCGDVIDRHTLAAALRIAGHWEEIVPGMTDLTVKYDPLAMTADEAEARFRTICEQPLATASHCAEPALLPTQFAEAPDAVMVTDALGIDLASLPEWLAGRSYRVTMMGFQPGFAYLEDIDSTDLPDLPRLDTPRQKVAAGSIGFLGRRACIYSLDGPGGWPLVGKVAAPLFRRDDARPFLLEPGQIVRFVPV